MEIKLNGGRRRRNPIKVDQCRKKGAGRWMTADGGRRLDTDGDRNRQRWMETRLHKNRNKRNRKGLVAD